jgi:hypothetical protein
LVQSRELSESVVFEAVNSRYLRFHTAHTHTRTTRSHCSGMPTRRISGWDLADKLL